MIKKIRLILFSFLIVISGIILIVGCSGSGSSSGSGSTPKQTSTITPAGDITGTWVGGGSFTNNCENAMCFWTADITMQLAQNGNDVAGTVTLHLRNGKCRFTNCEAATDCPEIGPSVSPIINGKVSSSKFWFTDSGGNFWELSYLTGLLNVMGRPGTVTNSAPNCNGIQSSDILLNRS